MIELSYLASNREIILFRIEDKVIRYYDKFWQHGIQILPMSAGTISLLKNSRSQHMKKYAEFIEEANQGDNYEEYLKANTEEELAEIIRKDCKLKGLREIKK